jgi:phosphonate transport system ATP-binding protein
MIGRSRLPHSKQFDLGQIAAQRADHLSGGQQQRVAIARALVQEPELILADEPIASLDPHNTRVVMEALQRINKHFGITVLCNLHSLDVARGYCDRLIGMAAGKVVFDGKPASLTDAAARVGSDGDCRSGSLGRNGPCISGLRPRRRVTRTSCP